MRCKEITEREDPRIRDNVADDGGDDVREEADQREAATQLKGEETNENTREAQETPQDPADPENEEVRES